MGRFIEGLKHAFALGPPVEAATTLPPCLERLAQRVVDRRLEMPAIVVLETLTPLNFLAAQGAAAVLPLLSPFVDTGDLESVAEALEDRGTLRRLTQRIEILSLESGDVS